MPALLILALLVSGIPAGSLFVPCARCCDEARADAATPEVPPCCRWSSDTAPLVAGPAPAGAVAARPAATGTFGRPWLSPRNPLTAGVMPPLHPAPLILRI